MLRVKHAHGRSVQDSLRMIYNLLVEIRRDFAHKVDGVGLYARSLKGRKRA